MKRHLLLAALLSFSAMVPAHAVDERYPDYELRPELAGEASVDGTHAPASLLLLWMESFAMAQRDVVLRTAGGDGGTEIKAALEAVAVLVNAENPLACISLDALRILYTDENPQWTVAGGSAASVLPMARETKPGEDDFFAEAVLGGTPSAPAVMRVARYSELLDRLAGTPGGIGYAPAGYRGDGVKALRVSDGGDCVAPSAASAYRAEYPLARFVYLEGGTNEVSVAFFDYVLSQEGQRDAVIAGFYSLPWVFAVEERKKLGLD
jgi:phosphate transport system substrate-binding protein